MAMVLLASLVAVLLPAIGAGLQIQCYQCEEAAHDCSLPDYVVNCTVNVQDTCQQEVLVTPDGVARTSKGNPLVLDNRVENKKKGEPPHGLNAPEVDLLTGNVSISRDLHQACFPTCEMILTL
ncbi:uncharacterized protein LOC132456533 isoform X2 [Gadus macrocephalus]|uniref:uncharacterized protein LOC132456533 isoform X2 n=1 Tax=Gadus macrocephalus TaxID=80720 RepID=UPI0028CBB5FF|nr:uncharacterized protein LOC132456533 isoform X2 [Gadus macrocephalus]